jgi:hypothetical protein
MTLVWECTELHMVNGMPVRLMPCWMRMLSAHPNTHCLW